MNSESEEALETRFLNALYDISRAPTKKISDILGARVSYINTIAKKLEEEGEIVRLKRPSLKHKYNFFDELFPNKGYLLIDLTALNKFTEELIDYVPENVTPSALTDLKNQVEEIRHNGLPDQFYQRVREYVDNLELAEEIESSISVRKKHREKKLGHNTITINGLEIKFMPSGDVWLSERDRIRKTSLGPLREDDGIERLYNAMGKVGYNMPSFEEFSKELSKVLKVEQ